jgi:hypothetical protein
MSTIETLMHANLLEVFGQRDRDARAAAIRATYAEDVEFFDPDEIIRGHADLDAKVQSLLDGAPGFVFSPAGPVLENHDMGYLAWNLGPEGAPPVVSGMDVCFIRDGLIAKVYTVLLPS